jgi:diacylglycerol kinase (ATP)
MENSTKIFSIASHIRSFHFAFRGLRFAFLSEHNLWVHTVAALMAIALSFILEISHHEWMVIVLVIGGVFVTELFNSAIESMVDLFSPEFNEKAGRVKDIAASAVLMAAMVALAAGLIIFLPKLM